MKYNPQKIEKKWQKRWEEQGLYRAEDFSEKPKKYILVEFPYPSGAGLHVGHVRSYTALDIVARKCRMQGQNVLYPMGWDAFGLPTENYAIKNKIHPSVATRENVATFKKQIQSLGISSDWSREINTTDPEYYKWTQWIFLQLFKRGLAYKKKMAINWCPSCKTGLANEEVVDGSCERCGTPAEQREKEQWMLAITKYADRLIDDLDTVEYLEKIKTQQKNWIGRSEGASVKFTVKSEKEEAQGARCKAQEGNSVEVFTTRVDTIFSAAFLVVAPEHSLVENVKEKIENIAEVQKYVEQAKKKTALQRTDLAKEKTGVELKGVKAINPLNGEELPVWVADFVLGGYGAGAVFGDAHDERDFEFAKKYGIPLRQSIVPFFSDTMGKDAVRLDAETVRRKTAFAFVKHWSEDKYLCLDWEKFGWHSGIIGGIEEGESAQEAAMREITEETGYAHPEFVRFLGGEMHTNFYAAHKGVNRYAEGVGMLFQLKDDAWEKPNEEETKNHKAVWIPESEMEKFLNLRNFQYMWEILFGKRSECFTDDGILIDSGEFTGLASQEAREKIMAWLEKEGKGKRQVHYKLRDWVFSRQHYWGEPIPLVHCERCGTVPVPEEQLPIMLPDVASYEPTDTGESPLAKMTEWVHTACPVCGAPALRETDTMPNWAGSSWYFLRYIDPKNTNVLADPEKLKYWMPIDLYNGGMEHTTLHLLYSRFWNKFLYDIGVVSVSEPYHCRRSHGMILSYDGQKMSKSKGNVINPDDVVREFGADSIRLYEMFMGPFSEAIAWNTEGVSGVRRFLEKVWKLFEKVIGDSAQGTGENKEIENLLHKTIKKVTEDIEGFRFNTAVSSLMILVNRMEKESSLLTPHSSLLTLLLSPFAPHIAEELWEKMGHTTSIFLEKWPEWDEKLIVDEMITMVLQVNGKVRDTISVPADITEDEAKKLALASEKVQKFTDGKPVRKVIFVKGKLVNVVV